MVRTNRTARTARTEHTGLSERRDVRREAGRPTLRPTARLRPLLRRADSYTLWAFNPPAHLGARPTRTR